ncbi:hypothetical protein CCACVL1_06402 [Corchorus capsularis]|uniref:Uncharacterized protein n=1 Tax=Corchorus capsularis TaxID=210143 RepID=A0A1R3JFP5_COCAP|nr:hypothetical protein CCACVL1_06402 [Corchorus capsularis]
MASESFCHQLTEEELCFVQKKPEENPR